MHGYTYDQLVQALQDWPQNQSEGAGEYVENIPRIIAMGEDRLIKDLNLDIFDTTVNVNVLANSNTATKPADWIATRNIWRTTSSEPVPNPRVPLHQRSHSFLAAYNPNGDAGGALFFAELSDTEWELDSPADVNYTLEVFYIRRPPGLSESNPTTWLATNVGEVLFTACLMEAEDFIKADDRYNDRKTKYYSELLPTAVAELRRLIRSGDYNPMQAAPQAR